MRTIFIGNPGTGKSTLLNSLLGIIKFKSGVSFGKGLTTILQEETDQYGNIWADTPGLSDIALRKRAAEEIVLALQKNGVYKIIFVMTLEAGRVRPDDITTMRLVHSACEIIGIKYSIVVNKVTTGMFNHMENEDEKKILLASLNHGLPGTRSIYFFPLDLSAHDEKDTAVNLPDCFIDFLNTCPTVHIKPNDVSAIKENEFEILKAEFSQTLDQLKNDNQVLQREILAQAERYNQALVEHQRNMQQMQENHRRDMQQLQAQFEAQMAQLKKAQKSKSGGLFSKIGRILDSVL